MRKRKPRSLQDLCTLLREGVKRLKQYASLYRRLQVLPQSKTMVLLIKTFAPLLKFDSKR